MAKIRPFDAEGWFPIHNAVFDTIMPALSPSAWKVLCVAIRQTWGWATADGQRRGQDRISYSQFETRAGLSRRTVRDALKECLDKGILLREQVGTVRGKPVYAYRLNRDYEVDLEEQEAKFAPVAEATGREIKPVTGRESKPVTGREIKLTKQKQTNNQMDGGGDPMAIFASIQALTDLGVAPDVAGRLAAECDPEQVRRWVEYARLGQGIRDPAALVVARLQAGIPAPDRPSKGRHTAAVKTVTCPGCWQVFPAESVCPRCGRCNDCCICATEE